MDFSLKRRIFKVWITRPEHAGKLIPSSDIFLPKSDPIDLINEILDVL